MKLIFFFYFVYLTGFASTAEARTMTADELDVRNRVESEAQKNLQNLIATRLDPRSFTIAVRTKVEVLPPPKPPKAEKPEEGLPAGMDLGIIDARELVDSYERQIEELMLKKEEGKEKPIQYKIKSIEIVVGLDESYTDDYIKQFEVWLDKKMKSDYGRVAKSAVGKVRLIDKPLPEVKTKPEENLIKDFGLPAAIALLAFAIFVSTLLLGRNLKHSLANMGLSQGKLKIESGGGLILRDEDSDSDFLDSPGEVGSLANSTVPLSINELLDKIAYIGLELDQGLGELVRIWMDSGEEGYLKTALFVDALIYAKERFIKSNGAVAKSIQIPLDMEFMKTRTDELTAAYGQMIQMAETRKRELLEKIYWDLISVQTLGIKSLRRPFDFLQGMTKENILSLLQSQKDSTRAVAVAYLPSLTQSHILEDFETENKAELLRNMLLSTSISEQDIWDIDMSLKVLAINQNSDEKEKFVDLFPKTMEVLKNLNPLDEIKILRQISPDLPDEGVTLKRQYPTLAFIDKWKPEYIRKLTQGATADELVTIIQQIPSVKDLVLNECPPKIKTIVEDDLRLNSSQDDASSIRKLNSLRNKWNRIAATENTPMSRVVVISEPNRAGSHAA